MTKPSKVDDIMDKVFLTFTPETTVKEAVGKLLNEKLFGACVKDKSGKVLGIISEKQCLKLYNEALLGKISNEDLNKKNVTDIMYPEYKTVPKDMGLMDVAQIFLNVAYRRLPVLEREQLVGQITRRDIVKAIDSFVR